MRSPTQAGCGSGAKWSAPVAPTRTRLSKLRHVKHIPEGAAVLERCGIPEGAAVPERCGIPEGAAVSEGGGIPEGVVAPEEG